MSEVANTQEVAADLAYKVETRIRHTAKLINTAGVRLAEDLYRFNEQRMYRDLGHDSFESWFEGTELGFELRWGYQLMKNWRELVVLQGVEPSQLDGLEPSKIAAVLPAIRRNHITVDEALSDVKTLSRNDLRERYGAQQNDDPGGGRPDTSTRYDAEAEPAYLRCPTCGQRCREDALR